MASNLQIQPNPTIYKNGALIALNPYSLNFIGAITITNDGPYITLNVTGGGTGSVTSVGTSAPLTGGPITTTGTIGITKSGVATDGYLSSTDWNTFNSKQPAGTYLTSVAIASSNGFAGSSSGGATPTITLSTTITGLLKGNGTAISAATAADVTGQLLTGYLSGAGTITAADTILTAIDKLNGNTAALVTGVSSVANSDNTITISPTTGAVVASLNLSHANTWAAIQTYNGVPINEAQGGTLASASTVNIGAATGNYLTISGSVTITAFDTIQAGTRRVVTFTGTPILTNSSALVLPWGNITVVAGDSATFVSTGGGNWICTQYQRSTSTGSGAVVFAASPTFTGTTTIGALTTNSASTQSIGGVTLNIGGNTTTTTTNILGGATVNTATSTVNINQGATASGGTKTTNISTAGLAGSTTNINIGAALGTSVITFAGQITLADTTNIAVNATTGTKIGTATTQKIGFWNTAPIAQPTTAIAAATFVANTSNIANDTATFDGYTIGQIVKAMRNAGLLA